MPWAPDPSVDQLLPPMGGDHISRAALDAGVELGEAVGFFGEVVLVELRQHNLHGAGDGVCLGELTSLEQSIEDRASDEVLGKHLDGLGLADRGVEVVLKLAEERQKGVTFGPRLSDDSRDACDMGLGDLR